jgi:hypothetical protein
MKTELREAILKLNFTKIKGKLMLCISEYLHKSLTNKINPKGLTEKKSRKINLRGKIKPIKKEGKG